MSKNIAKVEQSTEPISLQFSVSELRRLLLHSVEQMTIFRQQVSRDYQSVCTIVTTDIHAMYACQRDQYHHLPGERWQTVVSTIFVSSYTGWSNSTNDGWRLADIFSSLHMKPRGPHLQVIVDQLTLSLHLTIKTKVKLQYSLTPLICDLRLLQRRYRR